MGFHGEMSVFSVRLEAHAAIHFHGAGPAATVLALLAANALYRQLRPRPVNPIAVMIETGAAFIPFTALSAPITYLCARTDHALIDQALFCFDRWLGFDWDR